MFHQALNNVLEWVSAFDHQFDGSPYLILKAGHWCPECVPPPWQDDLIACRNLFFNQVWKEF